MITKLTVTDDMTLVTISNIKNDSDMLTRIFQKIADDAINLDMISQTPPYNGLVNVSFTLNDSDFSKVIKLIGSFKNDMFKTEADSNNTKLCFYSEFMPDKHGIAASVLTVFSDNNIPIKMITTSDFDISVLVSSEYADTSYEKTKAVFNL